MKIYLRDTVKLIHGHNSSRIKNSKSEIYRIEDMTIDLNSMYYLPNVQENNYKQSNDKTQIGQLMFNLNTYQAAVISKQNSSKIIDQNFVQIVIKDNSLDPIYLCYMLNSSNMIKRQESAFSQGVVVKRMVPNDILNLSLPNIDMNQQKKIGRIYALQIHEEFLHKKREKMISSLVNQILQNSIEEKENK